MVDYFEVPKGWRLAGGSFGDKRKRRRDAMGGQVLSVLIWNDESGEGEVLLTPWFHKWDWVTKADSLKDWLGLLEREYNGLFKNDAVEENALVAACPGTTTNTIKDEIDQLRAEVLKLHRLCLTLIQTENSCPATGGGCLAKRCGCQAEMEMLINENQTTTQKEKNDD